MRLYKVKTLIVFGLLSAFTIINARILTVPIPYDRIQDAINDADTGDTVAVWGDTAAQEPPYEYGENITIGENILVVNASFILGLTPGFDSSWSHVIIDGTNSGSVVTFSSGLNRSAIIKGFTIKNGNASSGGGVFCVNSCPSIISNNIKKNVATYGGGIHIETAQSGNCIVKNCQVDSNEANDIGGGFDFQCGGSSYDTIIGNIITNNTAENWGGGMYIDGEYGMLSLNENNISSNTADQGAGIWGFNYFKARKNMINQNNGEGVYIYADSRMPDFGNMTYSDPGYNDISKNTGRAINIEADLLEPSMAAAGNYWGSLDTDTIRSHLYPPAWVRFNPIAASDKYFSVSYNSTCTTDVIVTGDLSVNQGVILRIKQGKTIEYHTTNDCNNGIDSDLCELIVSGSLKAIGTSSDSITFTSYASSPTKGDWYGIRTKSNGVDSFDYCKVKYAYSGIRSESSNVTVDHSLIEQNELDGLHFTCLQNAKVKNCNINYNGTYGIYSDESSLEIRNCNLINNTIYGIYLSASDSAKVSKNNINGETSPVAATLHGIYLKTGSNMIIDTNTVRTYGQSGIYMDGTSETELHKNSIIDNDYYGLYCTGEAIPHVRWCTIDSSATAQVYCDDNSYPDLGTEQDSGYNSILLDCTYYVYNGNESGEPIDAIYNWWGSDSPDEEKFYGQVSYDPWLTEPPEGGGQSANIFTPPFTFALYSPKPNPARSLIRITCSLPDRCKTELVICDATGRMVMKLTEEKEAGHYEYLWHGKDQSGKKVSEGVYFIRLKANENLQTRKIVLTR
jgi:parallel beta-helix repeat protein